MAIRSKVLGRDTLMRNLEKITPGVTKAAADAKLEVAKEAANLMSAAAPFKTGEYMESIQGGRQADNPGAHYIGGKSKDPDATGIYASYLWRWLEFGTAPHAIKGKNGKNLVFKTKNGKTVVTRQVAHPGGKREPHIFPTWKQFRPTAKKMINAAINGAVKQSLFNGR